MEVCVSLITYLDALIAMSSRFVYNVIIDVSNLTQKVNVCSCVLLVRYMDFYTTNSTYQHCTISLYIGLGHPGGGGNL